jgi:predicted dehydrogenase
MIAAAEAAGRNLMTAFPCPFSPSFRAAETRFRNGEIGDLVAICATNRGTCPFDWFVDPALSGGGALIDHVVHVADLIRRLVASEPFKVVAKTSHNLYGAAWEDSALVHLEYPQDVFATLDSSWSRPLSYKTWGDVTMNIVGTQGVIELSLFNQSVDKFANGLKTHTLSPYGSNLDHLMVKEFIDAIREDRAPIITGADGRAALKVALDAYASLRIAA